MSTSWIEPPPKTGMGCFGKGCLTVVAFVLLLAAAFVGGTFFAVRFLRTSYFTATPVRLPEFHSSESEQAAAYAKWHEFERASKAHTASGIELRADEINALIASESKLRGKAYVSIVNDTARLRVSVPLEEVSWLRGRYMNAECVVQSSDDGNPAHARVTSILINGKPVGEDVLNWSGPWGFRRYISQWTDQAEITTFQVKDGKVILERKARPEE